MKRAKVKARKIRVKKANSVSRIRKSDYSDPFSSPIDQILSLQGTIGNQRLQKFFKSDVIQAKLRIGQPGDIYEQEADRVAEQMIRMPEAQVQRHSEEENVEKESIQTRSLLTERSMLQKQKEGKKIDEEIFQPKKSPNGTREVAPNLENCLNALKGGGQYMPDSIRAFFEPYIGYNFSHVRLHTDSRAAEVAKSLNAEALTTGRDIIFSASQYLPETSKGKKLLAHELTHVVQQSKGQPIKLNHMSVQRQEQEMVEKSTQPSYDMGNPVSNATEVFYTITESNFAKVHTHFKFSGNKKKYAAETRWNVGYGSWNATKKGNMWKVDPISWLIKSIGVELPKWKNFSSAKENEKKEWARFVKCTRKHEQGHIDLVRKFMHKDMPQKWKSVSDSNKRKLKPKMDRLLIKIRGQLKKISVKYDKDTRRGATQGAVLRPPAASR